VRRERNFMIAVVELVGARDSEEGELVVERKTELVGLAGSSSRGMVSFSLCCSSPRASPTLFPCTLVRLIPD
jgi:sorbitol-specific phosphotransferase system component IIBC